jgi:aspartyl-tRNA synthetase
MSFVTQDDIFRVVEGAIAAAFAADGRRVALPFPRMTYQQAMDTYGSDKPDLRFGLPIADVTDLCRPIAFGILQTAIAAGGVVRAVRVPGGAALTRKQTDELTRTALQAGAKGLLIIKCDTDGEHKSPLAKYMDTDAWRTFDAAIGLQPGDAVFLVADALPVARAASGAVRMQAAAMLNLIPTDVFALAWITDFPLFSFDETEQRWVSEHHPFTSPRPDDIAKLETDPHAVRACSYDLVLNGYEIASGSVRIHDSAVQRTIFKLLQLSEAEIADRFGFFINALRYGAPPHAGIAIGLDRLVMLILGYTSLRDVIAFPKTQKATDLMSAAPSTVRADQLRDLHIAVTNDSE